MNYTNPRTKAQIDDYPIGGSNRGACRFEVEFDKKKGYRTVRVTQNKFGTWCKPKKDTYGGRTVIADKDGRTYILKHIPMYGFVYVLRSDFKQEAVHHHPDPEYRRLLDIINSVYEGSE